VLVVMNSSSAAKEEGMEILATSCSAGGCPTVYRADSGDVVVQGYEHVLDAPDGEQAVRLPQRLLIEAVAALRISQPTPN
jgi:hypothetical protein